jgi:hypothetical protein
MRQIEQTEGAELLYTVNECVLCIALIIFLKDTDSVIVLHKKDTMPIKEGKMLGEMSPEYGNYEIKSFVCGGMSILNN